MPDIRSTIGLPPEETVEFFRSKGYALNQGRWDEIWQQEHGRAFTVTKMTNGALLEDVRRSLDKVISGGGTFDQWKKDIVPQLQRAGWYGKVQDREITGVDQAVFIGERRLRTIYQTNLRVARAAGQWKRIQALKGRAPYLMYDAVSDRHTRPEHRLWGGLDDGRPIILPVDHPAWSIFFPPCGWGCRCGVIQLSERDLKTNGWRVTTDAELVAKGWTTAGGQIGGKRKPYRRSNGTIELVPHGIDPGFAYNPGEHFLRGLASPPSTGALAMPHIRPNPMPPLPPSRPKPATALIDRETPIDEAIDRFLGKFEGPTDGITVLATDKLGEPLVIDASFFYRSGAVTDPSATKLVDKGRIAAIDLLADALNDPDEIWWVWQDAKDAQGNPRPRLVRRYVTTFEVGGKRRSFIVVMQFGQGGWQGVTAFSSSKESYLKSDNVRGGVLAYRRP